MQHQIHNDKVSTILDDPISVAYCRYNPKLQY